ncbi:hypothetical protein [Jeotgalibacillus marinus]|uniref:Type I toxin-antitoxin system Fst family toxin n=1 Tax=Jeotgalibacillus marinus TaxID=86667 RepID=A0ABV3Q6V5_9BACL
MPEWPPHYFMLLGVLLAVVASVIRFAVSYFYTKKKAKKASSKV